MTQPTDTLYADVIGRLDEKSFRQIEKEVGEAGERAGKAGGGRLSGAFGSLIGALPALAAGAAAAVGAALIGGATAVVDFASQARQGVIDIAASLGVTAGEAESLGETAKKVFGNNWTGSLAEAQAAVVNVRREIKGLASEDIQLVTEGTVAIADKFEEEQGRVAAAVDAVMKSTGLGAQQALDFITSGFQKGLNSSGDFLDTLTEYGPQFEKAKISGDQLFSLLETGAGKGALGTDKIADAFKEFGLTISDTSKEMGAAYAQIGLNQTQLTRQINDGTITQADAFGLVTKALAGVKDETQRTALVTKIFAGAGEDLGPLLTSLDLGKTKMAELGGSTDQVKNATNKFGAVFQTAGRQILLQLEPVGVLLLDLANEAMPAVSRGIAQVGPVIATIVRFLVDGFRQGQQVAGQFATQFGPQIERALVTFRPALQAIGPLFQATFSVVRSLWEGVLRPVLTAIAPLVSGVVATVGNTLTLVVRVVTGVVQAVAALFRGDLGGAVKALEGVFESGVTFVVRQVRNMASTILGLIRNLAPEMAAAAGNILRGLIGGIENGGKAAIQAIRNLGSGLVGAFKAQLGIQSPSRVMAEQGEFVAAGLAQGIKAGQPSAQKAATELAKGVTDEVAKARAELEKGISYDRWVDGLRSATRGQLEHAQALARSAGDAQRYGAIKGELERREGVATAATEKATAALKQQADQLAQNRKQIADGEAQERYVAFLRSVPDAQLASARATAASRGEVERYNAIKAEQERRENLVTAAQDRSTQAAKQAADQLASNRKQITDGLKFDAYVSGLANYTDAQLAAARSNALAAGDGAKFNAVLAVQKTRADEAAQAVADLAAAQLKAANSQYSRDPQGATDSAFRLSYGVGDVGLVRSLAAATGLSVQAIRDDVEAALADARRFAPETTAIIERVYADALKHRREVTVETDRLTLDSAATQAQITNDLNAKLIQQLKDRQEEEARVTARRIEMADEARAAIVQTFQAEQAATQDASVTLEGLNRMFLELNSQGRTPEDSGMVAWLEEVAQGTGEAAEAAREWLTVRRQELAINVALNESYAESSRAAIEAIRTVAQADADAAQDASVTVEGLNGMLAELRKQGRRPEDSGMIDWLEDLAKGTGNSADVAKEWLRVYREVQSFNAQQGTPFQGQGPYPQGDRRNAGTFGNETGPSQNIPLPAPTQEQIDAWKAEEEAVRSATQAHQAWMDNLDRLGFSEWVAGLKDLSDAELQVGLDAARASEDIAEFNAYLAEIENRELNVTLKVFGIDTGIKALDLYKSAINGVASVISGVFEGLASGAEVSTGSILKSMALMALGIVKQVAVAIAAYEAQAIALAIISGASFNFVQAGLALAAAAAVAGIVAGLESRLNQQQARQASTPTSSASSAPIASSAAQQANNNIQIPTSQVSVYASPEWVGQMGAHIDRFGGYVGRLVGEGIRIRTETSSTQTRGSDLAWELGSR